MTFRLRLSPDAEADIDEILEWSVERFGAEVRDGYEELISATLVWAAPGRGATPH